MAAVAALEMKFTYVMIYQGGMPDWTQRGYTVATGPVPGTMR